MPIHEPSPASPEEGIIIGMSGRDRPLSGLSWTLTTGAFITFVFWVGHLPSLKESLLVAATVFWLVHTASIANRIKIHTKLSNTSLEVSFVLSQRGPLSVSPGNKTLASAVNKGRSPTLLSVDRFKKSVAMGEEVIAPTDAHRMKDILSVLDDEWSGQKYF